MAISAGAAATLAFRSRRQTISAEEVAEKGRLLLRIDCTQDLPADKYFELGGTKIVNSSIGRYREAQGTPPEARFGYRFAIENIGRPHVAVIRYPDDKQRYMCIMDGTGYDLTTGVFTGGVQPISNTMIELRQVFWPRWKDCSLVFMTFRAGDLAAAAASCRNLRTQRSAGAARAIGDPADGTRRELGIQYEDPCGTCLSEGARNRDEWIDHLTSYAKYTGQSLLVYPLAWYHGPQFPSAREPSDGMDWSLAPDRKQYIRWTRTPADWYAPLLERFGKEGLQYQGSMSLLRLGSLMKKMNVDQKAIEGGAETFNNVRSDNQVQSSTCDWTGIYNALNYKAATDRAKEKTPLALVGAGAGAYGERHSNVIGPMFNPLHPTVQEAILGFVKEIGERYAKYPAFRGVSFNMFLAAMPWFGTIHFRIRRLFGRPVLKGDGRRRARRSEGGRSIRTTFPISDGEASRAVDRLAMQEDPRALRPDPPNACRSTKRSPRRRDALGRDVCPGTRLSDGGAAVRHAKSMVELYREAGIDVDLYRDQPGLEIDRGMGNSRDRGGHFATYETIYRDADLLEQDSIDAYAKLDRPGAFLFNCWVEEWGKTTWFWPEANDPNIPATSVMDGRPAEGIFRQNSEYPKDGFWWDSQSRITPGFQGGVHFLEPYAAALADLDACRITRGGLFLDKAHSEQLQQFARAYRALPKQKFDTVGTTTDPVAVRTLVQDGKRYVYAVNRDYYPVQVEMSFSGRPSGAVELSTGERLDIPQRWSFTLGPYELRSLAVGPATEIVGFTATAPQPIVAQLRADAEQTLAAMAKAQASGKSVPGMDMMAKRIRDALASGRLAWLRRALTSYIARKCRELGV